MRSLPACFSCSILAITLSLAAPARADDSEPGVWALGGAAAFAFGYINQAVAASISSSGGSKAAFIPIGGTMKLFAQAASLDCSHAREGYCDVARVLVPALLTFDLALETGGLGLMTYGAALAARKRLARRPAASAWAPFVSAGPSGMVAGVGGRF